MIIREELIRDKGLRNVAVGMMLAARTAPKAKGVDVLQVAMFEGDDIRHLSGRMKELAVKLDK
ncbi:MAG: ferredoxin, partial [Rikenellaceae bacterium]|nr:ferredoxin [Rikenellaceae bacterium]